MESGKSKKKIVRIEDVKTQDDHEKITEEQVTETKFHRTRQIGRGALDKSGSDSLEEDKTIDRAVMWNQDAAETKNLLSLWDLVSQNKEYTGHIQDPRLQP